MTHQICIHTNDKHYHQRPIEKSDISIGSWNDAITHKTIPNANALNGQVWDENEAVFWKRESSYEWIDDKTMDRMIKMAFLESSFQTPLKIRQRRKKTSDAQIIINWLGVKDERYFAGRENVLAFAYGPGRGVGGDITMNSDHIWRLQKTKLTAKQAFDRGMIEKYDKADPDSFLKTYDPLHTLKHEGGGHSLGMRHIENSQARRKAIMYPFYNGLRRFGSSDLAYLHNLYGKSSLNHKIKTVLLNRINLF